MATAITDMATTDLVIIINRIAIIVVMAITTTEAINFVAITMVTTNIATITDQIIIKVVIDTMAIGLITIMIVMEVDVMIKEAIEVDEMAVDVAVEIDVK